MTERNCVNIELKGEFDISNVDELARLLQAGEQGEDVILDCSQLEYIDSTGLTELFKLHQKIERSGGVVYLTGANPNVRKVFSVTNLDTVFKFRD